MNVRNKKVSGTRHHNHIMRGGRVGICFSGLPPKKLLLRFRHFRLPWRSKTGMFYQSVQGRIHSGAERLIPALLLIKQCTDFLRSRLPVTESATRCEYIHVSSMWPSLAAYGRSSCYWQPAEHTLTVAWVINDEL
jgi:hypothetical protein